MSQLALCVVRRGMNWAHMAYLVDLGLSSHELTGHQLLLNIVQPVFKQQATKVASLHLMINRGSPKHKI